MNCADLLDLLADGPVIAAVKDDAGLDAALNSDVSLLFLLYGDLCSLPDLVERLHQAGKLAIVHTDLITGLAAKEVAVDYVASAGKAAKGFQTVPSGMLTSSVPGCRQRRSSASRSGCGRVTGRRSSSRARGSRRAPG